MALLTLIRHGQSTYNLENRFTGSLDVELTPLGKKEAHQAAIKIKNFRYANAFTSMLKRARETLQIILEDIAQGQIPVIESHALDERSYGSLQGLNKAETTVQYGEALVTLWRRSYTTRPPEGESLEDTFNRTVPYYRAEVEPKLKANQNIMIVAHGNSLRALMMYLEGIDQEAIAAVNIPTGCPRNYTMDDQLKIIHVTYL